ncbi:hypothetical protein M0R89_09975 [Halorussus limi]|uniref:Uncharacterized protein n=1 Tax=Halorussus limi TaxID=2938695 RepID=A0A8U0HPA7_9EURY|nr:hypothetical protein [Halorussus limi]UPV72875.1 hypothetical protein M0R89_09975 [Halorussus limi]
MALRDSLLRRSALAPFAVALVLFAALAFALRRAAARARGVPLSPLTAGRRVGADYPERRGIVADGEVRGEMDDLREFAGPDFDPGAVHPAVRNFYERTADYELAYEVRWHRPFRLGAALAAGLTGRVEQLNLPGPGESGVRELDSRFARVDPDVDPRSGARAWVRTRGDGTAVFVAIYAHHERGGTRYVNIAVPLPGANLSTVLRPENLADGTDGLELTTLGGSSDETDGDEGLFLATPLGNLALPLDQRFRVRPREEAPDAAGVEATHEMWAFGRRFLTIRYTGRNARDGDRS